MEMSVFCCPICGSPLKNEEKSLSCPSRHSFDKAAQGHVHLLPSNKMHAKIPGDNKEMVAARKRFLEQGFYQSFRDEICRIVTEELKNSVAPILLDAGCGEGYYTAAILDSLKGAGINATVCGFDISKFAVKAAAVRNRELKLAVASCFSIPVADSSVDGLTAVFSPIVPAEFARVVKKGGFLLLAVAGERHLWGLKELLYEKPYLNEVKDTEYEGFRFEKRVPVRTKLATEDNQTIRDLFAMTPYYWKTSVSGSKKIAQAKSLYTELGFDLLIYRRI